MVRKQIDLDLQESSRMKRLFVILVVCHYAAYAFYIGKVEGILKKRSVMLLFLCIYLRIHNAETRYS